MSSLKYLSHLNIPYEDPQCVSYYGKNQYIIKVMRMLPDLHFSQ